MNKWDKLNSDFDAVLDRLTKDDWVKWDTEKSHVNETKKHELLLKALHQEQKIILCPGIQIFENERRYNFDDPVQKILHSNKNNDSKYTGVIFFYVNSQYERNGKSSIQS